MDITEKLQYIEKQLELYEEEYDPEEKMDLKQSISSEIKNVRVQVTKLPKDLQEQVSQTLDEFEEILTY